MQEVTFTLQTITPLFLAGADQYRTEIPGKYLPRGVRLSEEDRYIWQLQAELRPPAFRGLMRYWQRALLGGIVGTDAVGQAEVRIVEQDVFGTTDKGSSINIRISKPSKSPSDYEKESYSREHILGRDYLLWSMAKSGKFEKDNLKLDRRFFPSDTTFQVTLSSRDQDTKNLHRAVVDFWLLTHFGGIGSRSRRCAGSLTAKPLQPLTGNISKLPFKEAANIEELRTHLQEGIHIAQSLYSDLPQRLPKDATFDTLSSNTCKIWILCSAQGSWNSQDEAMDEIGEKLYRYRETIKPIERRAVFGLPLIVRDIADRRLKEVLKDHRQASPLLLQITRLHKEYVCVAVLFKTKAEYIPLIPPRDYSLIEKWVNTFSRREQVTL